MIGRINEIDRVPTADCGRQRKHGVAGLCEAMNESKLGLSFANGGRVQKRHCCFSANRTRTRSNISVSCAPGTDH